MGVAFEDGSNDTDAAVFHSALPIETKLERARVQLLDLSARNRLLNIPRSKARSASAIEVIDEKSSEVFRLLVKEGRPLTFLPGRQTPGESDAESSEESDEVADLGQPEDDGADARGVLNRHADTRLQTRLTSKGLQKRLLTLYFDARTLEEEQGVNVLYLALGTLKWIDPNNAANIRYAPLVLVPVSLDRATAGDRFKLRWRQEDPSSNLSLEAMVDKLHLLKLPAFEATDDFDVTVYCADVARAVASKPGWEVAPDDMVLGFFSFSKFLMYRDLSPDVWPINSPIAAQPLVRALLRDGFPADGLGISDDAQIDPLLPPDSMLHIVDSDSSQTMAVHDARQGKNLVIQGPPGTGKSQTIANIIAGAIADGKTVLFVAEKMAALEVVKRRLDNAGVGDACLELHSNKANKRLLLDELRRTWELGPPTGALPTTLNSRLTALRDDLNAHVDRTHRSHAVAGLTPFDVFGQLTRLRDMGQRPNDVALPAAANWSPDDFALRKTLLNELGERVGVIGRPDAHPWRGVALDSILPPQLTRLVERIDLLRGRLGSLVQRIDRLAADLERAPPAMLSGIEPLHGWAARVATAPELDGAALANSVWVTHRVAIGGLIAKGARAASLAQELASHIQPAAFDVSVDEALVTLTALPDDFSLEAFRRCRSLADLLPKLILEAGKLRTQLGFEASVDTLAEVTRATLTGQRVAAAPDASPEVFAAAVWDNGVEQAGELAEAVAKLEQARAAAGDRVLPVAWDQESQSERQILRLKGRSWLRIFSGEWRRARALVRSLVRDPTQPIEDLVGLLDIVGDGQAALRAMRAGDGFGRAAFGADWQAERSRSTPLRAMVAWMKSLRGLGAEPRVIAGRLPDRSEIGARATRVHQLLSEARPLLEKMWDDLGATTARDFEDVATVGAAKLAALLARVASIARCDATAHSVLTNTDALTAERRARLTDLRNLQELLRSIDTLSDLGSAAYGARWTGVKSDWSACASAAAWIDANSDIRELAAKFADRGEPLREAGEVTAVGQALASDIESLLTDLRADTRTVFDRERLDITPISVLVERLDLWFEHSEQLSKWLAYRDRALRAESLGLGEVVARLKDGRLSNVDVLPVFEMAYYEHMLAELARADGALARFDGDLHGRKVNEFVALDLERIAAGRLEVARAHHRSLPSKSGGVGPLGVLRAEMARRRGLMPIRQLIQKAGPAVQAIKPVLMMSPLSIAQFLPPGQLTFDLLVMDEASQIQPVDALGAIARCRQVVVVGDERQLPPTRFFAKVTSGDGEDDDDGAQVSDIESILGLFSARGLRQRMLRWHYRSRHQSLIAVSNSQFYENKLVIVPSPYTAEAGMGLSFHHLPNGVFDSGGSGANAVEAAEVAAAIIRHAKTQPEYSLGVATFSVRQRRAILEQVEVLRRLNPDTENFFHAHPAEPFFVKNLENVQGDERDVILISVGYGKNAQGVMSMRFGPLGADGGERRLNVLISRAKRRCEVYASITDEDIDLERARGKGVVAFKLFLRYARTARMDLASDGGESKADVFQAQVASALHERGYQVHPRVGIAGLFIDLAVADQDHPGRYILGIECDGASYRDARSARDRDRLRRAVLEDHGWIIHRIWSTDWLHRPREEFTRLAHAIQLAKHALTNEGEGKSLSQRAVPVQVVTVERENVTEIGLAAAVNNFGSSSYAEATIRPIRGYSKIPDVPSDALAALVDEVVAVEGPVHLDVVVLRIRLAWGFERAGHLIQNAVEQAAGVSIRARRLVQRGRFLMARDAPVVVRDRSDEAYKALRKPEFIAPEEIQEAILQTVRTNFGAQQSETVVAVARMFGIAAASAGFRDLVDTQVQELLRVGRVAVEGDHLVLPVSPKP